MTHERVNPSANPAWKTVAEPPAAPSADPGPGREAPPAAQQGWSPTAWRSLPGDGDER
ncbi:MAG: hypothetical protein ACI8PZ_004886 [Myxococcota bacterium]|jgi:hypothetical protein